MNIVCKLTCRAGTGQSYLINNFPIFLGFKQPGIVGTDVLKLNDIFQPNGIMNYYSQIKLPIRTLLTTGTTYGFLIKYNMHWHLRFIYQIQKCMNKVKIFQHKLLPPQPKWEKFSLHIFMYIKTSFCPIYWSQLITDQINMNFHNNFTIFIPLPPPPPSFLLPLRMLSPGHLIIIER